MARFFSLIIFFSLFFFLFTFSPLRVEAATLSISPAIGNFEVGQRVAVKVIVTSETPFNAVSGVVSFPTSLFSIESISKTNSVLNFWIMKPTISNIAGTVKFEGVVFGGFKGSSGTVITINLRAVKAGSSPVSFKEAQILAHDGEGTDITDNLIGANFSVKNAMSKIVPNNTKIPYWNNV